MAKLDPAQKSLRWRGFKTDSGLARVAYIEKELQNLGCSHCTVEHIYKGPRDNRTMTDMSVVDVGSNSVRERLLKDFGSKKILDQNRGELKIDRAKTGWQIQRNHALRKACDVL